jgi:translation initiation factor IF-3
LKAREGERFAFGLRPGGGFIAERGPVGLRVNERIRAREIRVIDDEGNQLGVMSLFDAMKTAREKGVDVVEISPTAVPPVCKLVDYGKFLYEQNKKAHETKKNQKSSHIKEVKFRPSTAEHDYQVRKNQIIRFLGEGYKVKAMIFHRGREMAHQDDDRYRRSCAGGIRPAHGSKYFAGSAGAEEGRGGNAGTPPGADRGRQLEFQTSRGHREEE